MPEQGSPGAVGRAQEGRIHSALHAPLKGEFHRRPFIPTVLNQEESRLERVESLEMSGLSGTKSDDFINAAKARGEAAIQDSQPRLTKLEKAFRHAALRRRSEDARKQAHSR